MGLKSRFLEGVSKKGLKTFLLTQKSHLNTMNSIESDKRVEKIKYPLKIGPQA